MASRAATIALSAAAGLGAIAVAGYLGYSGFSSDAVRRLKIEDPREHWCRGAGSGVGGVVVRKGWFEEGDLAVPFPHASRGGPQPLARPAEQAVYERMIAPEEGPLTVVTMLAIGIPYSFALGRVRHLN